MAEVIPTEIAGLDTHDPAGMAAFMRERARCSREFVKLTDEQQIRQFMEAWQRNVLPHFAFRFEQGAELIERLDRELRLAESARDYANDMLDRERQRSAPDVPATSSTTGDRE